MIEATVGRATVTSFETRTLAIDFAADLAENDTLTEPFARLEGVRTGEEFPDLLTGDPTVDGTTVVVTVAELDPSEQRYLLILGATVDEGNKPADAILIEVPF